MGVLVKTAMERKNQEGNKPSYDHEELRNSIKISHKTKNPLMVKGAPGIGKSELVIDTAKEIAGFNRLDEVPESGPNKGELVDEETGEKFVVWNEVPDSRKDEIAMNNMDEDPSDLFLFIDRRISSYDASDIKGIPTVGRDGADYNKWVAPQWVKAATVEDEDGDSIRGMLFFDEVNLAPPNVQNAFYQLIHDRKVGSYSISKDIHVLAAGNREGVDRANVKSMPGPLRDRFDWAYLNPPDVDEWSKWAANHGVDERVIAHLNTRGEDDLYNFEDEGMKDKDAFATPRSWVRVSDKLQAVDNLSLDEIEKEAAGCVGKNVASAFVEFIKRRKEIEIQRYVDDPEIILEQEIDTQWAAMSAIAAMYESNDESTREKALATAVKVSKALIDKGRTDMGNLMLVMCRRKDKDDFQDRLIDDDFEAVEEFEEVADEFRKMLY